MRIIRIASSAALALVVAALLAFHVAAGAQSAPPPHPKLAVLIVVDQMRADYVDRFRGEWTGGLKRLVTAGAWFRDAAYPYLNTLTCAGHATVSTGAFPHTHGEIQNAWWHRAERRTMTCTEDASLRNLSYGGTTTAGDSPSQLLLPSFADEMHQQARAHVVTLSLKDRAAIMLAGRSGEAVTWLGLRASEGWLTSPAYGPAPVPAVKAFLGANPIDADYGKTWTRLLPDASYPEPDDAEGEAPPKGWTRTFPHVLDSSSGHPDAEFRLKWERSPFADAYVGRFAAALVESMQLGRHDGIDVLGVSFSSPDMVGHAFGPLSQEEHDMYAHLDRTLGTLFERLDALVGRGAYTVALTADHGVTPIPEQLVHGGKEGGRLKPTEMITAMDKAAEAFLGPGSYVQVINDNDVYFAPGMYEKVSASPKALDAVIKTLRDMPGIARVWRGDEVKDGEHASDPLLRAAFLSYYPGRSGDLIIAAKPGWMAFPAGTTHGSANPDDQHVPILLMGAGIRPGEYAQPVTPADVAPTLAAIAGVKMPKAEGHPLTAAMAGAPPAPSK